MTVTETRPRTARWQHLTVYAGLAGYLAATAAVDLLNPSWSPVEAMVSHYVHADAGWLIPVALLSLAVASTALLRMITTSRAAKVLLTVWVTALVVGALFPTDPYGQWHRPPSTSGMIHGLAALLAFTSLPAAAVLFTRARPHASRPLLVTTALTLVTLTMLVAAFLDVQGSRTLTFGPWESLVGLTERLTLWTYVAWLAIAASATRPRPAL